MIEIKNLTMTYSDGTTPFSNLSVTINDGDVITLIGPSGTGKSTLIRCINLLNKPTAGEIIYNGVNILDKGTNINEIRKHIGMVFQSFNLFPHLTVIENVMFPQMEILKRGKQESYDKAKKLLKTVGLLDKALCYPDELSGGQKQRAAIARTLSMDCDTILLDEPTSALDPTMVGEVKAVIKELAKTGKTMIIVTHEMSLAKDISNRILFLSDGNICEDGSPDQIFNHPKNDKTRRFVNHLRSIDFHIKTKNDDVLSMISEIDRFASSFCLSRDMANRMVGAFEELIFNTLFETILDNAPIDFYYEYDDSTYVCHAKATYFGDLKDPFKDNDGLEITMFKSYVNEFKYSFDKETVTNVIDFVIKER